MTIPTVDVDLATLDVAVEGGPVSVDVAIPGIRGERGSAPIIFGTKGPVTGAAVGTLPFFPRINGRITRVTASLSGQTAGATRADVNISGVSIYTDQTQRPNLNGTGIHFADGGVAANNAFTDTDYITMDRDSSGTDAADLLVTVEYEPN